MTIANYTLSAAMIVQLSGANFKGMPNRVYLGLLSTPPTPEGIRYREIAHPEYSRQLIDVAATGPSEHRFRNRNIIEFGPVTAEWLVPTHGGVFDENGNLLFYGVFASWPPQGSAYQIRFKQGSIELRT